jgi:secreted Zn-dependent insulinase-like peptidase
VSAFPRKLSGGSIGLSIVIQSSSYLPSYLEERCFNWLGVFKEEIKAMLDERIKMEASAVVAQLTERNIRFSDEVRFNDLHYG